MTKQLLFHPSLATRHYFFLRGEIPASNSYQANRRSNLIYVHFHLFHLFFFSQKFQYVNEIQSKRFIGVKLKHIDTNCNIAIMNIHAPSSPSELRKQNFLKYVVQHTDILYSKSIIICGDFNNKDTKIPSNVLIHRMFYQQKITIFYKGRYNVKIGSLSPTPCRCKILKNLHNIFNIIKSLQI